MRTTKTTNKKNGICPKCEHQICECKKKKIDYKKAYYILAEYWDCISDEEKPYVDRKLKRLGL